MHGQGAVPAPGDTVLDRYVVERQIGRGTSSQVFQVRDSVTGLDYALKYPISGVSAFVEREVRFWLRLSHHRNVVSIADVQIGDDEEAAGPGDDERPLVLLEYVSGGTLRTRMTGRPCPVAEALPVLRDIAAGMAHANSRAEAVHLDLKPENVLFDEAGTAKVSDFGLVREVRRTRSGYPSVAPTTGTVGYQAPEIVLGTGPVDTRCDIFSFGLIAVELLTGQSIFPGDVQVREYYASGAAGDFAERFRDEQHPLSVLVPNRDLRVFIAGCLLPEVTERHPSFDHVLRALWRLGAGQAPAGIAAEQQRRVQADAARRALAEARILHRMDKTDAALDAANRSVLFSKLDPPTRARALGFASWVLADLHRDEEAARLAALSRRPHEATEALALSEVPVRPRRTAEALGGQLRKAEPFDPWPPKSSKLQDATSHLDRVGGLMREGRLADALDYIRGFLVEDTAFALTLASTVLSRTRTERETASQPLEEYDDQDPWFDCLREECDNCGTLGWASPVGPQGFTYIQGNVSQTGFSQCEACRLTLCFRCRSLWRDPGPGTNQVVCSRCGGPLTFPARPNGRTRPWGHDLRAAPVECVVIRRAGVLAFSQDWSSDLVLHVSPDLYKIAWSLYGGPAGALEGLDLLGNASRHLSALMDAGLVARDAPDRTEGVCGTDADGVPFAMLKVLRSAAAADKTIGLLFNIDRLGNAWYGPQAYQILFRCLDPGRLAGCRFSDGDTNWTLSRIAREYCIAVEAPTADVVAYIRATMSQCQEPGLLLDDARFLDWAAVTQEPLVEAGTVSEDATLVVPAGGLLREFHAEGTTWRIREAN